MNWLTRSFEEHTIVWLAISSIFGGIVGASVKFLFEDLLRPRFTWHRETAVIVRRYTTPLIRSAEALERRINILVRNHDQNWFEADEYFRLSTLYVFGEFLGWVRILERRFGFLPFESSKRGRQFNRHLNGLFRALSSHAYFRWHHDVNAVDKSQIPRLMLTAIGEAMREKDHGDAVLQFTEFLLAYARDPQFRRWFAEAEVLLRDAHPANSLKWDRLIATGANLRALIVFLDPNGTMVPLRDVANLDLLQHREVREDLATEFPHLMPAPGTPRVEPRRTSVQPS